MYYHIEGMDLAGKSTASKAVISKLGSTTQIRHNTIQEKSDFHKVVDLLRTTKRANSDELGELYYQVLKDDIGRFESPTCFTIQDSTIALRSLAWYSAQDNPIEYKFAELLTYHPRFTNSIVLTANIDVRQLRLQLRIKEAPETVAADDMLVIENPELFLKMEKSLVHYSVKFFGSKVLDTSNLTKYEVASKVLFELGLQ